MNKQAQLRNDIIEWLHEQKVGWSSSESESLGVQFINTLSSALWEIDGNHHTLDSRGFGVPKDLANFQGYNKPELHKKRKIGADSLVESKVSTHSVALLELSNQAYMHLKVWHNIRGCMLQLANNLRKYANYLKNQKENTATNARKISFVQSEREQWQTHNVKSLSRAEREHYGELHNALHDAEDFQVLFLNDFAPTVPWKKHNFMKGIALRCKAIQYTYSSGMKNLNFIWKIPQQYDETTLLAKNVKIRDSIALCCQSITVKQ